MKRRWDKHSGIHTPGPGDLFQEYESTLHCALVVNVAEQYGEFKYSGGKKLLLLVEDRHILLVPPRPQHRGGSIRDLPAVGSVKEGWGWRKFSLEEKGQGMTLSQPSLSPTGWVLMGVSSEMLHLLHWQLNPQRHSSAYPLCLDHSSQQHSNFPDWQVEGGQYFPGFAAPPSAQLARCLQEPALNSPSSSLVGHSCSSGAPLFTHPAWHTQPNLLNNVDIRSHQD